MLTNIDQQFAQVREARAWIEAGIIEAPEDSQTYAAAKELLPKFDVALSEIEQWATDVALHVQDMETAIARQLTPLDVAITHIGIIRSKGDDYSADERDNVAAIVEAHTREARDALFAALPAPGTRNRVAREKGTEQVKADPAVFGESNRLLGGDR